MFLDRVQEHLAAGNRPSGSATIKLGANRDGKLVALIADAHGTGGVGGGADVILPYVYSIPNTQVTQSTVRTNFGSSRAMRAPRHPQSCTLTEAAMDDLADKLGMDPIEFRLKNLAPADFHTPIYEAELKIGAELIGWSEKRKPRGQNGPGPIKRGFGVALHQWGGGGAQDKKVSCTINPDGSVELKSATQDIGISVDSPGDHRRRSSRAPADRHYFKYRQLDLSAGSEFGGLDHNPVDGPTDLRCRYQGQGRVV